MRAPERTAFSVCEAWCLINYVGAHALPARIAIEGLLDIDGPGAKNSLHRLKQAAGRASWSAFRELVAHLRWVDSLGDTDAWLDGIAESKIADFAGEAACARRWVGGLG